VHLATGQQIAWDRLILTTGARASGLAGDWSVLDLPAEPAPAPEPDDGEEEDFSSIVLRLAAPPAIRAKRW
jgi:hypothetical protein